jgi:Spy/CpxP family protein refolding chaperone
MKNSLKLILSLTGVALLAAPVLRADEPVVPPADQPAGHEWRKERREEMRERFQHLAKELNFTADQNAQAEVIFKQTGGAFKALHDDTSLTGDQKRAKMQELRKSTRDQLHALMTPEQQAKAKELREKHGRHGDQPPADKPPGQ